MSIGPVDSDPIDSYREASGGAGVLANHLDQRGGFAVGNTECHAVRYLTGLRRSRRLGVDLAPI